MRTIVNEKNCLVYGLPGIAILIMSLAVSFRVGSDFGGDTFVCSVSFLGCNGLLWIIYLLVFQYLPMDIMTIAMRKTTETGNGTDNETKEETESIETIASVSRLTGEEYSSYCKAFERSSQEKERQMTDTIIGYVNKVMAPFATEENLRKLCDEIALWCRDATHTPEAVSLKKSEDCRKRLKTLDFKHFIWNIGARLGTENGYSGIVQAEFAKRLFAEELADVEIASLKSTMTLEPNKGYIKLDRPVPDSYGFHI